MRKRAGLAIGAIVATAALGGGAVAYAAGGDSDRNVTGARADRAIEAGLDATNGGTANSVELDGENGATWEVEVTRTDGSTVDVRLDQNYSLIVIEGDGESTDGGDSSR